MTCDVVVYGATGLVGRAVCARLDEAGAAFALAGRDLAALHAIADWPHAERLIAPSDDPAALARAFAGARVVVSCAPAAVDEPILVAALQAGAHYVDVGGDQAAMHALYERHESTARKAGCVALLGAGVDCALGDFAAAWAAAYVCGAPGERSDGDVIRAEPVPRLADDRPLDDVAISYVFDDLVLSPAGQRAVFAGLHARGLAWRRDRWEPCAPAAETRRVNAGLAMGGEREVSSFPGGDVISVPRHIASARVQTFASTTRRRAAQTALRLLARAMPLVPARATEALAAYEPSPEDYARTIFAIVAQAKRGFSAAQVIVRGADLYATSACIAAWCARQLVARTAGPVGMRAASELFRPAAALAELAGIAGLTVEPSFA
ncbi:MAG TPA: saccharopine dehydrogenase NADP-binding domain-containing protein [Kofleriaceae bacterium]